MEIGYKNRIVWGMFVIMGGEFGRDIKLFRDLVKNPSEEMIDKEAKFLMNFEKICLKSIICSSRR